MAVIYCSTCGKQANDYDNICSNCGNPLKNNTPNQPNIVSAPQQPATKTDEITENIATIKKAANIIKILFIILAVISFIMALVALSNVDWDDDYFGLFVIYGVIGGILLVFSRFIEAFIKWKAYMLETNYEIVKNVKNNNNKVQ